MNNPGLLIHLRILYAPTTWPSWHPLLTLLWFVHAYTSVEPQTEHSPADVVLVQSNGSNCFPWGSGYTPGNTVSMLLALAMGAHCWFLFSTLSTHVSSQMDPSLCCCIIIALFLSRSRTLNLPLLNLMKFQSNNFSSQLRFLFIARPFSVLAVNSIVGHQWTCWKSISFHYSGLMKTLNSIRPSGSPWGTPLVTSH